MDRTIGGKDILFQLEESKFGMRKYHHGHHVEGVWLFGGVEVTSKRKFFCIKVEIRNAAVLTSIILKFVKPGLLL
ncbi:hypothetical protein H311_03726 [Anncaliia algerae PRA109]|nr:hypothetical protein H311_03726 [Anncaliia algerae PRA109]